MINKTVAGFAAALTFALTATIAGAAGPVRRRSRERERDRLHEFQRARTLDPQGRRWCWTPRRDDGHAAVFPIPG